MLNQETPNDLAPKTLVHNPLNEHNYCSPTPKNTQPIKDQEPSNEKPGQPSCKDNLIKNVSSIMELEPSTSISCPSNNPTTATKQESKPTPVLQRSDSNDHLSDSSSSISSSSSEEKGLVIAQDRTPKTVTINPAPSTGKRRPGRPPKREMNEIMPNIPTQARAKRPRQNISVTDKSEWITGDDQIDSILSDDIEKEPGKRKRVMSRDTDHFYEEDLSSDYSLSDAGSDDDSDNANSEDDPDRLWCVCRKPHGGKFMICCDVCKDWFHGVCVGVTKLMGDRFEKEGKEWFCNDCQEKLKSGIPRNAIQVVKEKKKNKKKSSGKRGRGRPRKSDVGAREIGTRASARNLRKSLDSKSSDNGRLKRNLSKSEARIETFDEFDSDRLKVLIKERKKEFFYKRQLAEQQKAAKRNELGLGRRTITANLSDSLDSLASSTNAPNMNNLPINIKSDHAKERQKPNIVLQINVKKEAGSDQSNPRIVTAIMRSPKKIQTPEPMTPSVDDLFTAEPIQITKKPKVHAHSPSQQQQRQNDYNTTNEFLSHNVDKKPHQTSGVPCKTNDKSHVNEKSNDHSTPPKIRKRKDSDTTSNGSNVPNSQFVFEKIKVALESRCKTIKDLVVSSDKIDKLAKEIESQLNECFEAGSPKYNNKFRSLVFNLRDSKNQCLVTNVLNGDITPAKLVRMSPEEMASNELAKWRERENKHSIELIKRDAQLSAQQLIVKKTHKGEEVITAPSINDPDDPTAEIGNQDTPTTPTKAPKDGFIKQIIDLPTTSMSTSTNKNLLLTKDKINDPSLSIQDDDSAAIQSPKPDIQPPISLKISNEQDSTQATSETPANDIMSVSSDTTPIEKSPDQPKRFRVTIETSLNASNLSRLKEPLVKPLDKATSSNDGDQFDNSSPNEDYQRQLSPGSENLDLTTKNGDNEALKKGDRNDEVDDDIDYDPEAPPPGLDNIAEPKFEFKKPEVTLWRGTISMPDLAKFKATARAVEGDSSFMTSEINHDLTVCGRIAPDQVQSYIKKLKSTTKNEIVIIQLRPDTTEDKAGFTTFFDYLYGRNRYGVIQTRPHVLKDFYIIPLHERSTIPDVLKPLKHNFVNRKDNNCLLGLLVKNKR